MVTQAHRGRRKFRFGVFELDEDSGELRREGKAQPRLRDQASRILLILLERPRSLVTREEFRERIWSSETFVDFDHGLNAAVNQLRGALGDSAASPRFIETLPRRGYRFIAPVEVAAADAEEISLADSIDAGGLESIGSNSILSDARELPTVSSGIVRTLFALIQIMYLSFYVISLALLGKVEPVLAEAGQPVSLILDVLVFTAALGIPLRLYLLAAVAFHYRGVHLKFLKLFPFILALDLLWALAPFLLAKQIGLGLAIGITAALLYLPFSQRSLLLMGFSARRVSD